MRPENLGFFQGMTIILAVDSWSANQMPKKIV